MQSPPSSQDPFTPTQRELQYSPAESAADAQALYRQREAEYRQRLDEYRRLLREATSPGPYEFRPRRPQEEDRWPPPSSRSELPYPR
jgi:hypothetical protein